MQNNIYLLFNQVSFLVKNSNYWLIILSVFISFFASILIALRQKFLFNILNKKVDTLFILLAGSASMLASLIAPFFTGSLTFTYLISKKYKVSYSKIFGIVLLDFIIGLLFTVIFGFIGAIIWGVKKPIVVLVFLGLVAGLTFFVFKNKSFKILKSLITKKEYIYKAVLVSFLIFLLGNIQGYLFFLAFNLKPNFILFVMATSIFGLMNLIPGIPAKIGQYELVGAISYWYLLNADKVMVGTVLLTQHAISLSLSILIGLIALLLINRFDKN